MKRAFLAGAAVSALLLFGGSDLNLGLQRQFSLVGTAAAQHYDIDFGSFYRPLRRYGRWVSYGRYGLVWVPRRSYIYADWRPYTDGRWAYTDEFGWLWISYEPWGWATYHYGSWGWSHHLGWFWVPGYVWAPAWVTWRYGPDYVGWAAIPPEAVWGDRFNWFFSVSVSFGRGYDPYDRFDPAYSDRFPIRYHERSWNFVPRQRISEPRVVNVVVAPEQHITIINNTTIVNNYTVVNQTVVNRGLDIEQVNAFAEQPVQRVRVETVDVAPAEGAPPDRQEIATLQQKAIEAGTIQVFRPVEVPVAEKDGVPQLDAQAQVAVQRTVAESAANTQEFAPEEVVKPEEVQETAVVAPEAPPLPDAPPAAPAAETSLGEQPQADEAKPAEPTSAQPPQGEQPAIGETPNQTPPQGDEPREPPTAEAEGEQTPPEPAPEQPPPAGADPQPAPSEPLEAAPPPPAEAVPQPPLQDEPAPPLHPPAEGGPSSHEPQQGSDEDKSGNDIPDDQE